MTSLLRKCIRRPWSLLTRTVQKLLVGPAKYGRGRDYDAPRYWSDRLGKYGTSLRGAGHEGLTEAENAEMYQRAGRIVLEQIRAHLPAFPDVRVAEVGVGSGFYPDLLRRHGVKDYTGFDVTDVLFDEHGRRFEGYRFKRLDVTRQPLEGTYDLLLLIDVVEHIVIEERFSYAMRNLRDALAEGGLLLISGLAARNRRLLFYVRQWTPSDVARHFEGCEIFGPVDFHANLLLVIRKPPASPV